MKDFQAFNLHYWRSIPPALIHGNNYFPGNELTEVLPRGSRVLDGGCGAGAIAEHLSKIGYRVEACDINKEAIARLRRRKSGVRYFAASLDKLPARARRRFDAVSLAFVFANQIGIRARKLLAKEVGGSLKRGGIIWIHEPLVTPAYRKRYRTCRPLIGEPHSFFVYRERGLSAAVKTASQAKAALKLGKVERIAHHFQVKELCRYFPDFRVLQKKNLQIRSPRSGTTLRSVVLVMEKK